ncbi:class I SAM-dependent methyltransferase [Aliarcobacter cryaerophilus]|uniref:class I SAM-dependent methyltransferase n=1 Tax=Aliarcobacter cryaerophilus TaxID=28198 RepID=UPI003DA3E27B
MWRGTLSFHLAHINKIANFTLVDYMEESIEISKKTNQKFSDRFSFTQGDIYNLNYSDNYFDIVFCWQTLSWLDNPQQALRELVRVVKSGGKIYLSSLFNLQHDVDIYSKVYDHTRESGKKGIAFNYNTYSQYTINKWLDSQVKSFNIHPFSSSVPFDYDGKGLGTFTKKCHNEFLQISAGMLMNLGILEIEK